MPFLPASKVYHCGSSQLRIASNLFCLVLISIDKESPQGHDSVSEGLLNYSSNTLGYVFICSSDEYHIRQCYFEIKDDKAKVDS